MKPLAEAAAKAAKHREWHWCRRPNGFCDLPKWRMVAERLGMPLYQVVAFVNRLEEYANDAGNKGYGRGEVGHFSAAEFGTALGMPEAEAARIFATLEEIGWVAFDYVATFYDRNRDDDAAAEGNRVRQRRSRARGNVLKKLMQLARLGRIDDPQRTAIESQLRLLPDPELFALLAEIDRALLSTAPLVTRYSRRDNVTVTPEHNTIFSASAGDNSGDSAPSESAGLSEDSVRGDEDDPQAGANAWLDSEGTRIVTERMGDPRPLAATRIARWRDQQLEGNAVALLEVIQGADKTDYIGPRFHNLVVDGIKRWRQQPHPELPLRPGVVKGRRYG